MSTYGIVAAAAPTVVLLRRGPSHHTRLLLWHLDGDRIEDGQWLASTVNPGPCAVSPNGKLFLYEARKRGRRYTVVSRPPYFTALALWWNDTGWTGGGFFADDRTIVLGASSSVAEVPRGYTVTEVWTHVGGVRQDKLAALPEAHHGWIVERGVFSKGRLRREGKRYWENGRELSCTWADLAHDGSLLTANGNRVYRNARLIADLSDQKMSRVPPPKDGLRWPR